MTSLVRLSTWRFRLSRLCGLSHSHSSDDSPALSQKKQPKRGSSSMERSPEKMKQTEALHEFIQRVEAMAKSNQFSVNLEFAKLRAMQEAFQVEDEYSMSEGFASPHNRYRDVVPYNKNRIRLKDNGSDSDYINASLIEYPEVSQRYIAAQAPLAGSIDNFWHMIGQYRVRVVAMLCSVVENSIVKCFQYWPVKIGEIMELGFGTLETLKEDKFDHFVCREIQFKSNMFGEFVVYQLHYTDWPDHGRPETDLHIPTFVETMDDYQNKYGEDAPILVHCSAGVGRTGSIIGVDIYRTLIRDNKINHKIDLKEFVLALRKQRTAFVQSSSQYQLLHALVAHYCKQALDNLPPEPTIEAPTITEVDVNHPNGTSTSATTKTNDDEEIDLVADKLSIK